MTTTEEDWRIQTSIKHGPVDDRGNPMWMTNIRGKNAAEYLANVAEFEALALDALQALSGILAVDALVQSGAELVPMSTPEPASPAAPAPAYTHAASTAEIKQKAKEGKYFNGQVVSPCPVNPQARHRFKTGTGDKGPWKAIMCSNKPECGVDWIRD